MSSLTSSSSIPSLPVPLNPATNISSSTLSSTTTLTPSTTASTTTNKAPAPFTFPPSHSFPPLYTLQPNPTTRTTQLQKWSHLITLYCTHHFLFRLSLPSSLTLPLFKNSAIKRRLDEPTLRAILNYMASDEGGHRAEWIVEGNMRKETERNRAFVFWKRPEEWADAIWEWVEARGLRGAVVTVWEMLEGEGGRGEVFAGMDEVVWGRALGVLVKRGRAQVFGEDEGRGVKFF